MCCVCVVIQYEFPSGEITVNVGDNCTHGRKNCLETTTIIYTIHRFPQKQTQIVHIERRAIQKQLEL